MGPAIQGFARGCEAESCDFENDCGYSYYVWRSDGIHESAGLFVCVAPFLGMWDLLTTGCLSHVSTYTISGHRFTHHSASLLLYRITRPATTTEDDPTSGGLPQARLLDPSGTYILQASVRVQDGSKVETMAKGANELLGLKETLKGVVDLEIGDRLALDTRVR